MKPLTEGPTRGNRKAYSGIPPKRPAGPPPPGKPKAEEFKLFRCDFVERRENFDVKTHRHVVATDEGSAARGLVMEPIKIKLAKIQVDVTEIKMNKRIVL